MSAQIPTILTDVFRGFPQSIQENSGMVLLIKPRPLPPTFFPIHYSLLTLYFDTVLWTSESLVNETTNKMAVFSVVVPCSVVEVYQRFRGPCCLHQQGDNDGGSKDLWNVGKLLRDYTALQPRRQQSSYSPPWEPQILLINNRCIESQPRRRRCEYRPVPASVTLFMCRHPKS
jgi:hypothetical protein